MIKPNVKDTVTHSSALDTPVIDTPAVEDKPAKPKKKSVTKKEKLDLDVEPDAEFQTPTQEQPKDVDDVTPAEPLLDEPEYNLEFEDPHYPEGVDFNPIEPSPPVADDMVATIPSSDSELSSAAQGDTELPTEYFDTTFNDMEDFGEQSTYHHVQFSGLQANNNRVFGAIPIYSQGMFDIASVRDIIMRDHNCIDVAISGWQAIESREVFNALYGDVSVDDTGEGVTYYHVHYILSDNEGRQVFGHTPAQTAGILNLKAIRDYLAGIYNTTAESVVIMSWQPLANVEEFAILNGFTVNTVENTTTEQ